MDLSGFQDAWRARLRQEETVRAGHEARARAAVPVVAALLRERGCRRVWLIGSLAAGGFRASSGLDFMAEGLDEPVVWEVAGEASRRTGFAIDVLVAEVLSPVWRAHHERFGDRVAD